MNSEREQKLRQILEHRLASVTIVMEALHLRHNISAVMRSAEAFGVHDVHLISNGASVSRGPARGAERWVRTHTHSDTDTCLSLLKKQGFEVWVADLHPDARSPDAVPIDRPIAVVMGTELAGVSDRARSQADGFISVPMAGLTRSLNVSVAAACILFRLSERRRNLIGGGDLPSSVQQAELNGWLKRETRAFNSLQLRATAGKD